MLSRILVIVTISEVLLTGAYLPPKDNPPQDIHIIFIGENIAVEWDQVSDATMTFVYADNEKMGWINGYKGIHNYIIRAEGIQVVKIKECVDYIRDDPLYDHCGEEKEIRIYTIAMPMVER